MTEEQLFFIDDLIHMLSDTCQDKSESYEIITTNKNGKGRRVLSREEYLEHVISTTIEDLRKYVSSC